MKRLTKKTKYGYASLETNQISECSDKLGQLEDLMEKYHIEDLEALDDALLENYLNIKSKFPLEK